MYFYLMLKNNKTKNNMLKHKYQAIKNKINMSYNHVYKIIQWIYKLKIKRIKITLKKNNIMKLW